MRSAISSAIIHETWPDYEALQVFGDLDLSNGDALQAHLDHAITLNRPLVIDLMRCEYLSCSEVNRIIRAKGSLTKPFLVLVSARSNVERFMQLSGAASVLTVYSLAGSKSGKRYVQTGASSSSGASVSPAGRPTRYLRPAKEANETQPVAIMYSDSTHERPCEYESSAVPITGAMPPASAAP